MEEDTELEAAMYIDPALPIPEEKMAEFTEELRKVINKCSLEQYCNTPDFILAEVLGGFFEMHCLAINMTSRYVGEDRIYYMRNINTNNKEN